jgi:hydroxyacylglutathione hydrolase
MRAFFVSYTQDMAIEVIKLTVGPMNENCYLVTDDVAGQVICIDPGWDGDFISQKILETGMELVGIYVTHGHFDHVMGLLPLKLNFATQIYMSKLDLFLYKRANSTSKHFLGESYDPVPPIDHDLMAGDKIKIGNIELDVIAVPGHTPGSLAFYKPLDFVFVGDLIFAEGEGRTDFEYANKKTLDKSIEKILSLPDFVKVYSGHGEPSTIEEIKKIRTESGID